jgi:hypothetical protein
MNQLIDYKGKKIKFNHGKRLRPYSQRSFKNRTRVLDAMVHNSESPLVGTG